VCVPVVQLRAASTLIAGLRPGDPFAGDPATTHTVALACTDVTALVTGTSGDLAWLADVCRELRTASPAAACPGRAPLRGALGRLVAADTAVPVEVLRAPLRREDLA
jgi:hypothetical protein